MLQLTYKEEEGKDTNDETKNNIGNKMIEILQSNNKVIEDIDEINSFKRTDISISELTSLMSRRSLYFSKEANHEQSIVTFNNEQGNIILQNDGAEDYVHTWNVSGLAKPSDEQLTAVDSDADTLQTNEIVRDTRKAAYGNIGDQLDEIYKDIDAWKTRIKAIKDSNPKS